MYQPKMSQQNLEHFALELAKKFMINATDVLRFTNEYWGTNYKQLTLDELFTKMTSKTNSRASSVASTPRVGATGTSISSLASAMEQLESFDLDASVQASKRVKTVRPTGPRDKKCVYKFKVGKRAGQECGVSCVGSYCAKHQSTTGDTDMQDASEDIRLKPADSFTDHKFLVPEPVDPSKRKISKKQANLPASNIQAFIQERVASFKVERYPSGLLVNAATKFVYDETNDLVYGKLQDDGKVIDLTVHDIEYCKSIRINYQLPTTLGDMEDTPELQIEDPNDDYEELSDGE